MTKNQFKQFAKDHGVKVEGYSGNDRTMYVSGDNNKVEAMLAHLTGTELSFTVSQVLNPKQK